MRIFSSRSAVTRYFSSLHSACHTPHGAPRSRAPTGRAQVCRPHTRRVQQRQQLCMRARRLGAETSHVVDGGQVATQELAQVLVVGRACRTGALPETTQMLCAEGGAGAWQTIGRHCNRRTNRCRMTSPSRSDEITAVGACLGAASASAPVAAASAAVGRCTDAGLANSSLVTFLGILLRATVPPSA